MVAYLKEEALPATVQAVRDRTGHLSMKRGEMAWWRAVAEALRLPPVLRAHDPESLAAALRQGYVAIFTEHGRGPFVGPTTLELLLTSPKDASLPPPVRRLTTWSRLLACTSGLLGGALLIAVSSYHHALVPGPFLVSMAATRQNMPFPIVLEMFLAALLGDIAVLSGRANPPCGRERYIGNFLKETSLTRVIEQVYHNWGADPVGFGQRSRTRFPTHNAWLQYYWPGHVKDLQVSLQVDLFIRRFGSLLENPTFIPSP